MGSCSSDSADVTSRPEVSATSASLADRPDVYTVVVDVCQGRKIKKTDLIGRGDPYVLVKVDTGEGGPRRTVHRHNTSAPVWNRSLRFDGLAKRPASVTIVCMDHDLASRDEVIGQLELPLNDLWGKPTPDWKWYELFDAEKKVAAELQLRVRAIVVNARKTVIEQADHNVFTHLIAVQVGSASNLKSEDLLGGNDALVVVRWGTKTFETSTVKGVNVAWNQTAYLWASFPMQSTWMLEMDVYDRDLVRRSLIGSVYTKMDEMLAAEGKMIEKTAKLGPKKNKDKDLNVTSKAAAAAAKGEELGTLNFSVSVTPLESLKDVFFASLLQEFDTNNDGKLQKSEFDAMVEALGIENQEESLERFWAAADRDNSGFVNQDEALPLLNSLLFLSDEVSNRLLFFFQKGSQGIFDSLMEPARNQRSQEIKVIERTTGRVVAENIPVYIRVAMKMMYSSKAGRLISGNGNADKIVEKLTRKQGAKYDSPHSVADIPGFIKLHALRVEEVEKPLAEFKTFNEFFYRSLKPNARPVAEPGNERVALCPADCRLNVFPELIDATRLWIKGDEFTVASVLGPLGAELGDRYSNGSLAIARLAPQDYHRWHFPVSGMQGRRALIPGGYTTVNPIAINQNVNVYTRNKRMVLEVDSPDFGKVLVVAVGAMMVGSIFIIPPEHTAVKKGDQHGYFAFGGSTVMLFFEKGRIVFDPDLVANSQRKLETLVQVNTRLGVAP